MSANQFCIAHISDLHFSEFTDGSNPHHAHSVELLVGLQEKIQKENLDLLIVSGDVSNHGDRQSLINAYTYVCDQISLGGGKHTGLGMPPGKVGVVPGNHDAWNASKSGPLFDRRQKSLENFNFAFSSHQIPPKGCHYQWLEKSGSGIFIAYVDSCFLGDSEDKTDSAFGTMRFDERVAKGKLSVAQTETLLKWYDLGIRGQLAGSSGKSGLIPAERFQNALKILVMHHYLFEPPEKASDFFMTLQHRDLIFRNIAFSDFDVLICGHKHIPSFSVFSYGDHFDRRARNRYLFNYFRRLLGMHSLPLQLTDDKGRKLSKRLTLFIQALVAAITSRSASSSAQKKDPDMVAEELLALLRSGLEDHEDLEVRVREFMARNGAGGLGHFEAGELKSICKRITIELDRKQRRELARVADQVTDISGSLAGRSFLQLMSGSSSKASNDRAIRSFQVYDIADLGGTWRLESRRYIWDWRSTAFAENPLVEVHEFRRMINGNATGRS